MSSPFRLIHALIGCVFLLAALLASAVAGQASSLSEQVCLTTSCQNSPSSELLSFPGSTANSTELGQAWAEDYATLKSYVSINATNDQRQDSLFAKATAVDRLFFPGLASGTVDFVFNIEGQTSFGLTSGETQVNFIHGPNSNLLQTDTLYLQTSDPTDPANKSLEHNVTITMDFSPFLDYNFSLQSRIQCSTFTRNPVCDGAATVDLLDTMKLIQLNVHDANGNLVEAPLITSDSGFNYSGLANGSSAVPEPGAALPVGLVLGAVCLLRRRVFHRQHN